MTKRNRMSWNIITHRNGEGWVKVILPPEGEIPKQLNLAKVRGARSWMERRHGRQVTLNFVSGTVKCEQE
jgi:hypothetical protein